MSIIDDMRLKKEKKEVEEKAIKVVNGYFRSHDIPLHAFKQKSDDKKDFASGKTDWMTIPIAPNNKLIRFGYNTVKKFTTEPGTIQEYINNDANLKAIQEILNNNIPGWYFNRIKRSDVEQGFLVDVTKRKNS